VAAQAAMSAASLRRANLWLCAAVALLGWLAWSGSRTPPPAPPARLLQLDPESVTRIVIEHRGLDAPLHLQRDAAGWRLLRDGRELPADPVRVDALLRLAGMHSSASYALTDRPREEFGLDPPQLTIQFDALEVRFGHQEPLQYRRYVEVDDRLHLVNDTVYVHATQPWPAYVDPRPTLGRGGLAAIDAGRWRLRAVDGSWAAEGLDAAAAAARAAHWQALSADRISALQQTRPAPDHVILEYADGSQQELGIRYADAELQLSASADRIRYHFPRAVAAALGLDD
jgi:hypothetical protein